MSDDQGERIEVILLEVAGHEFWIDINSVREIRGWTTSTPLPQSPDYVLGVINLRGTVMPVLDLSARLGFGQTEVSSRHVIVVVEHRNSLVGLLVDVVQETIELDSADLQSPPNMPGANAGLVDALIPRESAIFSRICLDALLPEEALDIAA